MTPLLSSVSNVRIDNYVYTLEALDAARRCLRENGRLAMLYSVPVEEGRPWSWIRDRLVGMAVETFGSGKVLLFVLPSSYLNLVVVASTGDEFGPEWNVNRAPPVAPGTILPTDDWPFLYLEDRIVPGYHVVLIGVTLLLGSLPIVLLLPRGRRRPHWNFFLLGAGFLLLETSAITRISLLFGSTWVVNSIVFFSILVMVLVANLLVQSGRGLPPGLAYGGICVALILTYLVDIRWFLYSSFAVKAAVAAMISGLPILFAGFVFSHLFRKTADVQHAFGSNLLGAFFGGFCEYLGMVVGLNNMLMIAVVCYLASLMLFRRGHVVE